MSELPASTTTSHAAPAAPAIAAPSASLALVRRIGYAVLGLQLTGFAIWSAILYSHFALTFDFAIYNQAWFLIAHGNLNPFITTQGFPFWQGHCEFIVWPLALFYWIWPHGVTLLWLQDISVVIAEGVAFTWICELASAHRPDRDAIWLAGSGLALLAVNPWIWWSVSFDFHSETLAIPFVVLLARDLASGRRRVWAWVPPLLTCGDVAGTYLFGLGISGVLAGSRYRRRGVVMAAIGLAATLLIALVHGNKASGGGLEAYAYLAGGVAGGPAGAGLSLGALAKGIASHPLAVLRVLWAKRLDMWTNLAPSGLLGVGFVWTLPIVVVVLLANSLFNGLLFAIPSFQDMPLYVLVPAGTVAVLVWLMRHNRRAAFFVSGALALQAVAWTIVFAPVTPGRWLKVSSAAAATLADIDARIPESATVVASQGVAGRFSGRTDVRPVFGPRTLRLGRRETWFVIAPSVGVETQSTASAMALITELAGPLHASLVTHANGIWAFRWNPPPGEQTVTVPGEWSPLPAWAGAGAAGGIVTDGSASAWHMASTGSRGYVADGLQWQVPAGKYQALVSLSTTGPVNVEVWNDTRNTLLARRMLVPTDGAETVSLAVNATAVVPASIYSGWGPFRGDFIPPPPGNRLEVRVWSPGSSVVNVYSAELRPAPAR